VVWQDSLNSDWDIVGTSLSESSLPSGKLRLVKPTIVVLGNEGAGLRPTILRHCTQRIKIGPAFSPASPLSSLPLSTSSCSSSSSSSLTATASSFQVVESLNVSVATGVILYQLCESATTRKASNNGAPFKKTAALS